MKKTVNVKIILLSALLGVVTVVGLARVTGQSDSPSLPFLAMLSGYLLAGLLVGFMSESETIIEPGVAALAVGLISYFIIKSFDLRCFGQLEHHYFRTNMMLITLNGVLLTFVGAWAGEKLQGTFEKKNEETPFIEWGWIIGAVIVGVSANVLLVSVVLGAAGLFLNYAMIVILIGMLLTGYFIGLKSPGVTIKEATIGGIITTVIGLDIFKITLDPITEYLSVKKILVCLAVGVITSYLGSFVGERAQEIKPTKVT